MTTLGRNVAANVLGAGFIGIATLAAAPLYLRWLGAEAYGLIGFQLTMQSLLVLLDVGFSVAINREIASLSATGLGAVRSVVRTAMPFYWIASVVFAMAMIAAAPLIATQWIEATALPAPIVISCLRWMAIALAAHFVSTAYAAGLAGLQLQVLHSTLLATSTALRLGGGAVIAFVMRDPRYFFAWQAAITIVQALAFAIALQRALPPSDARFDPQLLRGAWQLARGVAIISALAAVTTQADRLAVSRSVPLTIFGYYAAASLIAMAAAGGAPPVANAAFPRFVQLLAMRDHAELKLAFHRAMQTTAAIVLPVACVLAIWSREVLFVWTGDRSVAAAVPVVTALLVIGMAMNALLNVPYVLQLAHGWTAPAIVLNAVALVTFVPAMFVSAAKVGAQGTAIVFASMHAVFLIVGVIVTQRRLLKDSTPWWFLRDVGPPLLAATFVGAAGRLLLSGGSDRIRTGAALIFVMAAAALAAFVATPAVREWVTHRWQELRVS